MNVLRNALPIAAICAGIVLPGGAHAVMQPRQVVSLPTNYCQSALPVFDGLIRKRPLAVQNEGAGDAFITCSYPSGEGRGTGNDSPTYRIWQYFLNNSSNPITIACTGVSGDTGIQAPQYIVKSLEVAPGGSGQISWFAEDFDGAPAVFPSQSMFSISCAIPPGGGLRQAYINSEADVGN